MPSFNGFRLFCQGPGLSLMSREWQSCITQSLQHFAWILPNYHIILSKAIRRFDLVCKGIFQASVWRIVCRGQERSRCLFQGCDWNRGEKRMGWARLAVVKGKKWLNSGYFEDSGLTLFDELPNNLCSIHTKQCVCLPSLCIHIQTAEHGPTPSAL